MQNCISCNVSFEDSQAEISLRAKIGDAIQKGDLPEPKLCCDCRLIQLMSWRNERILYTRMCDKSGKKIISVYPQNVAFPVYEKSIWWGDSWNATNYGQDYDFNRPFFEQFAELQRNTPRASLNTKNVENCDYCNFTFDSKDSYLTTCCYYSESILYSFWMLECKDCTECSYCFQCQNCLQCTDCNKSYGCYECVQCNVCTDSSYLFDCRGCTDCFCSVGLRNAKYHMFNEKLSKEEFENRMKEFDLQNPVHVEKVKERLDALKLKHPHKYSVQEKCEDSTGDHIVELKDCKNCYQTFRSRDCINVTDADGNNDLLDCYHTGWSEMIYEGYSPVRLRNSAFEVQCWDGNDIFYSDTCQNCSYCFGCISLRQNKYCILNKQYSKEEYEVMLYKIINHMKSTGEWGKFFPNEICIFSYNDSVAQDVYPLEKEEAIKRGWKWQDNLPFTMGKETTTWNSYEMKIEKVQEDILNEIFACECCKKNYRIIRSELKFYKQMKLPLSRLCSGCRHLERIKTRNPRNLHNRTCNKCNKEIQTTFAPERPEKVYCEECYLKEVY